MSHKAILEDISQRGASVQLDDPLDIGAQVELLIRKHKFPATVRHCTFREPLGYFVGLEFDPAISWSEKALKPEHLLDPRTAQPRLRKRR
jgi:hypothetical protein